MARSMQRQTNTFKLSQAPVIRRNAEVAVVARQQRATARALRNKERRTYVARAPKRKTEKKTDQLSVTRREVTDISITYVADVSIPIQDERTKPVNGLAFDLKQEAAGAVALLIHRPWEPGSGAGRISKSQVPVDGRIVQKDVPLPAALSIKPSASDEWVIDSTDGAGEVLALTVPTSANGQPVKGQVVKKFPRVKVRAQTVGKVRTVYYTQNIIEKVPLDIEEPVIVRREVADFVLPKPKHISSLNSVTPKVFIGETAVTAVDHGDHLSFKVKRDLFRELDKAAENVPDKSKVNHVQGSVSFTVQYDSTAAGFGTILKDDNVDFYEENKLPEPKLVLESIPDSRVFLDGKPVNNDFPLSPLQWQPELMTAAELIAGTRTARPPREITGQEALKILGVSGIKYEAGRVPKNEPNADYYMIPGAGNHKGRFGLWFCMPRKGLWFRCRYELDGDHAGQRGQGMKFLPPMRAKDGSYVNGILEAIRVVSPEAGSIGDVLKVGASRAEILNTFGPVDSDHYNLAANLKLSPSQINTAVLGDPKIEAWDDTLLYGGIRIKWNGDLVKWFEISRPLQLLYNGTKAFDPPQSRGVYIGQIVGDGVDEYTARRTVSRFVDRASGVREVNSSADADFVIDGRFSIDVRTGSTTHQKTIKVERRDSDGNLVYDKDGNLLYDDKLVDEDFDCPTVSATGRLVLGIDDKLHQDRDLMSFSHTAHGEGRHREGRRCDTPDRGSVVAAAREGGSNWAREFGNWIADAADLYGTVIAVNYLTGEMLINLGRENGVQDKSTMDVTQLWMYLLHSVDPQTGSSVGDLNDERIVGDRHKEWLEVQRVGPDWCVAQPKRKDRLGKTITAWGIIPRLIDPGSGLVRVKIARKRQSR